MPLSFDKQFSFDNYLSEQSDFIAASLKSVIRGEGENLVGLWGAADSGKTHLVNSCACFARNEITSFQIYDGLLLAQCDPEFLQDLEGCELLLIDNLDAICGHRLWEQKFYQIINQCKQGDLSLIFTLSVNPGYLECVLDDFQSRLNWGLLLQLQSSDDRDIGRVLSYRASLLGIDLTGDVVTYLLRHYSRRLSTQIEILRILDLASLSAQKKISVPLVKQALKGKQF